MTTLVLIRDSEIGMSGGRERTPAFFFLFVFSAYYVFDKDLRVAPSVR